MQRLTPEDYHALATKRGFEWLGPEVPNVATKTRWRCGEGHEWWANYGNIRNGSGCPACSGKTPNTPEDYHALAAERGFEWSGPEVPNTRTKTKWRCGEGHEWNTSYSNLRNQKKGCRFCAGLTQKGLEDYRALAAERDLKWVSSEVPANTLTNTRWRCGEGHEWETSYNNIQQGRGCRVCAGFARKTPEDYRILAAKCDLEWVSSEVPASVLAKTMWRCSKGHEWKATHSNIKRGTRCPVCNESKGETAVANALDVLSIRYNRQARFRKCRNNQMLPFDFSFAFNKINFLIEYDGQQHHEPVDHFGGEETFETRQLHDQIKDEFAAAYGFTLIRIPHTVENIQSYLIQAIADACGIEYGDVLALPKRKHTAVTVRPFNKQLTAGVQMPLL